MSKHPVILLFFSLLSVAAVSQQAQFSITTDLSLLRSIKKEQRFWAVGQTVQGQFHFSSRGGIYALISYYTPGKFTNNLSAIAKSSATIPQQISYVNNAEMRFKQISIGWKRYLKGGYDSEEAWNLYGIAGFGLILGRIQNSQSVAADTALYNVPVTGGKDNFKRLTADLGLGYEVHLGGAIYFYAEGKVWIPTTDYPSSYIFINKKAPLVAVVNAGIRILFD